MDVNSRVIVRIWVSSAYLPEKGIARNPGITTGHVSMEVQDPTVKKYISFYPNKEADPNSNVKSPINDFEPEFKTLEEDLKKSKPSFTFCFYSLKTTAIKIRIQEIMNIKDLRWAFAKGSFRTTGNTFSCVSLVWDLLTAGGIRELISKVESSIASSHDSSKASYEMYEGAQQLNIVHVATGTLFLAEVLVSGKVPSPDALVTVLEKAKDKEMKEYPETKKYKFNGE